VSSLNACAIGKDMILELKDVQFFQAQQTSTSPIKIKVSGLAFHSSMAVSEITTLQSNESIHILVHLVPATGNLSGKFDYELVVPDSINKVNFGNENALIWTSSEGIVKHE
jgi:hypothetical protein